MLRLTMLLTVFSYACSHSPRNLPERPDTNLCTYNHELKAKKCFNMRDDMDENGRILSTAVPYYEPVTDLKELNKETMIEPDPDLKNLKIYLQLLRYEIEN